MKMNLEQILKKLNCGLSIEIHGMDAIIADKNLADEDEIINHKFDKRFLTVEALDAEPVLYDEIPTRYYSKFVTGMLQGGIRQQIPGFPNTIINELKSQHLPKWADWLTEEAGEILDKAKAESGTCLKLSEYLDEILKNKDYDQEWRDNFRRDMLIQGIHRDFPNISENTIEILKEKKLVDWPDVLKEVSEKILKDIYRGKEKCADLAESLKDICEFTKGTPARAMTEEELDALTVDEKYSDGPVEIKFSIPPEELEEAAAEKKAETEKAPEKTAEAPKLKLNLKHEQAPMIKLNLKLGPSIEDLNLDIEKTHLPTAQDLRDNVDVFNRVMKEGDTCWLNTPGSAENRKLIVEKKNGILYIGDHDVNTKHGSREILQVDALELSKAQFGQTVTINGVPCIYMGGRTGREVMTIGNTGENTFGEIQNTLDNFNKSHGIATLNGSSISFFDISQNYENEPENSEKLLVEHTQRIGTFQDLQIGDD